MTFQNWRQIPRMSVLPNSRNGWILEFKRNNELLTGIGSLISGWASTAP
jgi:hypothetical protein